MGEWSLFGIGPLEVIFIVIMMLIILGPRDMVKTGRKLGETVRKLRESPTLAMIRNTAGALRNLPETFISETGVQEMQEELLRGTEEIRDLGKDLEDLGKIDPRTAASDFLGTDTSDAAQNDGAVQPDPIAKASDSLDQDANEDEEVKTVASAKPVEEPVLEEPNGAEGQPEPEEEQAFSAWTTVVPDPEPDPEPDSDAAETEAVKATADDDPENTGAEALMRKAFSSIFKTLLWPIRAIWWLLKSIVGWIVSLAREFSGLFADDPEETDLVDSFAKAVQDPGGILVHVNEFRQHITRAAIIFLLMTSLSFFFAEEFLEFLARPIGGTENLIATEVTDPVRVFMRVGLLAGFVLSLPYIVLELLLFAAPGLKKNERRIGLTVIPLITILFVGGAAFSYYVILEPAITVLTTGFIFEAIPRPSDYYGFITQLLFWFGIAFEFPLVLYIVVRMGWIRANQLLEQSRIALVVIAVVAAMITPTVDPINMLLVWGPLVGLYFLGVGMAFIAQNTRDRRIKKEAARSSLPSD